MYAFIEKRTKDTKNVLRYNLYQVYIIINFRPQTKQLAIRHQEVIKELNAKMAEKAEAQIRVNETNDELDMVNINVDEIEEEILVLKEQVRHMIFSKV